MVGNTMRYTSNKGFNIESHDIESTSLQQVRNEIPKLMEDDADIIVLNLQQGLGKSFNAMQYMSTNSNTMFLTSKHALLDELEKYFNNENLDTIHWRGISNNKSPCIQKNTKLFKDLINLGYKANFICEIMACDYCPYKDQFKHTERVLAPIQYLNTNYLENDEGSRFKTFIVDESITQLNEYPYDLEYLLEVIKPLYHFSSSWFYEFLQTLLKDKNIIGLESYKDEISIEIKNTLKTIYTFIDEDNSIESIESKTWKNDIIHLSKFNIDDIITSLKFQKLYNFEISDWYEPNIYKVFNLAQKSKIILLHATFNLDLFKDMLSSYSSEIGINKTINVKVFNTKLQNKSTKVYNVNKSAYYPNYSLERGAINEIGDHVELIANQIGVKNVGIIGLSKYNKYGEYVDETFLKTGIDALHFGNSTGRNILEDKQCLVVAGSWMQGGIVEEYNKLYLDKLDEKKCKSLEVDKGTPYTFHPEIHPKLHLVQKVFNESELLDGMHRNRGLIHDNRTIVAFSHIPEQIYHDFTVIEDKKIELSDWKDIFPKKETPVYELVKDFLENSELNDYEIAKELELRKDDEYDVELVIRIRKHWNESKEFGI
ncbi:hypothetical protein GQ473_03250 [archaeon]|nr:hypothetical protein [archaeon]